MGVQAAHKPPYLAPHGCGLLRMAAYAGYSRGGVYAWMDARVIMRGAWGWGCLRAELGCLGA